MQLLRTRIAWGGNFANSLIGLWIIRKVSVVKQFSSSNLFRSRYKSVLTNLKRVASGHMVRVGISESFEFRWNFIPASWVLHHLFFIINILCRYLLVTVVVNFTENQSMCLRYYYVYVLNNVCVPCCSLYELNDLRTWHGLHPHFTLLNKVFIAMIAQVNKFTCGTKNILIVIYRKRC